MFKKLLFTLVGCLIATQAVAEKIKVDPALKSYKVVSGVSGNLNSIGSDSLNNLMTYWSEGFNKKYPNVNIQVEGKGSATAPPALIEGTAQLAPMSRAMKASEIEKFQRKFGYKPLKIAVAYDSLAVFVNKDNPVKTLSLEELDAIFSRNRKRGLAPIHVWSQVGVKSSIADSPISVFGRNSASGTYAYFKDHVLKNGDYSDSVKEQPGSASVVQSVGNDIAAIGYSGIGYATSSVKALPLSLKKW